MNVPDYTPFKAAFGSPKPGTAADLHALGLEGSAPLREFSAQVGGGMFQRGLISVISLREQVPNLGGWEHLMPEGLRLFASSAFGFLMLTHGEDLWILNTQYNDGFEAEMTIQDALMKLCDAEGREDHLKESLFQKWSRKALELAPTHVLSLSPPLALGGIESRENLREMDMSMYLSITAQLFH
jgi:hypothetical protein